MLQGHHDWEGLCAHVVQHLHGLQPLEDAGGFHGQNHPVRVNKDDDYNYKYLEAMKVAVPSMAPKIKPGTATASRCNSQSHPQHKQVQQRSASQVVKHRCCWNTRLTTLGSENIPRVPPGKWQAETGVVPVNGNVAQLSTENTSRCEKFHVYGNFSWSSCLLLPCSIAQMLAAQPATHGQCHSTMSMWSIWFQLWNFQYTPRPKPFVEKSASDSIFTWSNYIKNSIPNQSMVSYPCHVAGVSSSASRRFSPNFSLRCSASSLLKPVALQIKLIHWPSKEQLAQFFKSTQDLYHVQIKQQLANTKKVK